MLLKHYLESGLSKTASARQLGVSRRAIYHWIQTGQLDRELSGASGARRPAPRPTKLDRFQPLLQERLTVTLTEPDDKDPVKRWTARAVSRGRLHLVPVDSTAGWR